MIFGERENGREPRQCFRCSLKKDLQFDIVILGEVLEHVENHRLAIQEISRILKPGGVLLFATPNVMRLDSRAKFFLSAFHKPKRRFVRSYCDIEHSFQDHNYPVHLPVLSYLLLKYGLKIETIISARRKTISYILYPIFAPFVLANLYWTLFLKDGDPRQRDFNKYLWRLLTNRHVLMDDTLVLGIRKKS